MSVTVIDHPLIQHKLSLLRDRDTNVRDFRAQIGRASCRERV